MTVSNSLVGRVIGRSGAKINRIQEASGAHITVSRNIPKSAERLVTIKVWSVPTSHTTCIVWQLVVLCVLELCSGWSCLVHNSYNLYLPSRMNGTIFLYIYLWTTFVRHTVIFLNVFT